MPVIDTTNDPTRQSWVESANQPGCQFPIQNLPYGVFSTPATKPRVGVAIGDQIVDLAVLEDAGLLRPGGDRNTFDTGDLNAFMALGPTAWRQTRDALGMLLDRREPRLHDDTGLAARSLVAMVQATMHLPIFVRSFTDFYASKEHATNVGAMFRDPANALMPNWLHIPIGYNGRASTVVVSGTDVRRPLGQLKAPTSEMPSFGPSAKLDIELELGAIVGQSNTSQPGTIGTPVTTAEAYEMIFGYVLLNDWSARDIQAWEYQPLGPFQAKAFATSISPWVVTRDALEPFRVATPARIKPLLPYLAETTPNNFDIALEIAFEPAGSGEETVISRTNYRDMYYSAAQQLAHHTSSGCTMCVGDLLGSGTISGATRDSLGSLLELALNGQEPLRLPGGTTRTFLEDGDRVTLRGWCDAPGYRIGFGECIGTILPAIAAATPGPPEGAMRG